MRTKAQRKDLHTNSKKIPVRSNKVGTGTLRPNIRQIIKDQSTGKFYSRTVVDGTPLYNEVKTTKE